MLDSSPTRRFAIRVLATTALAWMLCLSGCGRQAGAQLHERSLKIAMDLWPGYYPLFLAQELGYLEREGIELEIVIPQDTQRMKADFAAKQYDGICISFGDVILMTRAEPNIRWVYCADESLGADQIVGSPVLQPAGSIRGKTLSTTLGGFGELFLRRYIASHGLTAQEVTIVNADSAEVAGLLQSRQIDAGHTWEPYATMARNAGAMRLYSSEATPGLIVDGLVVHQSVISEKREALRGLTRGWTRAVEWWKQHPQEADALLKKRLAFVPGASGEISLSGIRLLDAEENRRLLSRNAPGSLHATLKEYVDFFLSRGTLGKELNAQEILDARFAE